MRYRELPSGYDFDSDADAEERVCPECKCWVHVDFVHDCTGVAPLVREACEGCEEELGHE